MKCPHCSNRVWFWQDKLYHFADDTIGLYFDSKPDKIFESLHDDKSEKYHLSCYKFMIWQESMREHATVTDEGSLFNLYFRRMVNSWRSSVSNPDRAFRIYTGQFPSGEGDVASGDEITIMDNEEVPDDMVVEVKDDRWKRHLMRRVNLWLKKR